MNWDTDPPEKSGYYWFRKNRFKTENLCYVWVDRAESIARENATRAAGGQERLSSYAPHKDIPERSRVFYVRFVGEMLSDKVSLGEVRGQWWGPIQPPPEE